MFSLVKFFLGLWLFIIVITGFVTYVDSYQKCDDRGGHYNITIHGFKCQGADK